MATSWVVSSSRGAPWFNAAQRHSPLDLQAAAAAAAAKHLISHPHVRGVVKLSRSTGPKRMLAAFSSSSGASRRAPNPQTIEDVIEQAQKAVERALEEGKLRQLLQILLPVDQRQFNFLDTEPRNFSGFHQTQIRSTCSYNLRAQKLLLSVNCSQEDGDVDRATSSVTVEPKWKQKLAAADDHAERTRQRTQLAQEEYKQKQAALQRLQGDMSKEVIPLRDLEFLPYLSEEGLMTNCSEPNAKASVYAIFDKDKVLQYIGISRQVYMSMRLHFARMPLKCYHVKVQNITKPSRSLLELIRDKWIDESGSLPKGNDNGPEQSAWENPLDCKPMMTGEEIHKFKEANPGPPKAKVLKNVARRVEAQLENYYQERNCKERLRFDPKLKEKGLLDLKNS